MCACVCVCMALVACRSGVERMVGVVAWLFSACISQRVKLVSLSLRGIRMWSVSVMFLVSVCVCVVVME